MLNEFKFVILLSPFETYQKVIVSKDGNSVSYEDVPLKNLIENVNLKIDKIFEEEESPSVDISLVGASSFGKKYKRILEENSKVRNVTIATR